MVKYLRGTEIAAEVKLVRSAFAGAIVVVEGDSDCKVYSKFFDLTKSYLLQSRGRDNLIEALECLNAGKLAGIVGIADADFWRVQKNVPKLENLTVTDEHDLEVMMVSSNALEVVLSEFGSTKKISNFFSIKKVKTPRTWLFRQSDYLGRLRLTASVNGIPLDFKGLNFSSFIPRTTIQLNKHSCFLAVLANTRNTEIKVETVKNGLSKLPKKISRGQLCCGDELVEILAIALRHCWGSQLNAVATRDNVAKLLRLAYSSSDFERTDLYQQLCQWQSANAPYKLFG